MAARGPECPHRAAQVRKTESSLKRLKKGRAAEAAALEGGAAQASDTDKISMQLFLDVQVRAVLRPF